MPKLIPSRETQLGFFIGIFVLFALFTVSRLIEARARSASEQSVLFFDPPSLTVPAILQAQTIRHQFRLVNRSDSAMQILGIHTSCSCAVGDDQLPGKVIPPNNATPVPVAFDSGTREGPISAKVRVYVQDKKGRRFEAEAELRTEILSEFTIEPNVIDFGRLQPGHEFTRTVMFVPKRDKSLTIKNALSTHSAFKVSLLKREAGDLPEAFPQAMITFHAPNTPRRDTLSTIIRFETSNERVPTASIYTRGEYIPEIEVAPDVVVITSKSDGGFEFSRLTIRTEYPRGSFG